MQRPSPEGRGGSQLKNRCRGCPIRFLNCSHLSEVRPDWALYCILGNFSKPVATGNGYFVQIAHILGNFCKGFKTFDFSSEIIFGQLFIDIWRLFAGHTSSHL